MSHGYKILPGIQQGLSERAIAVQSSPSLFFFNSYELRPTVRQALWGLPSTRMNATVLFLLACLPDLFPHYRSLYFFVLGSITKEAECHLLASQQASGPFQDASLPLRQADNPFQQADAILGGEGCVSGAG